MKPFSALLSSFRSFSTNPVISNGGKPRTFDRAMNIKWTDQQLQVIEAVKSCQSVFITGSAGTGKTKLIEEIVKVLRKIHGKQGVFVTASTGIAACALSGQTIHSFAGVGLAEADSGTLLTRVLSDKRASKRWMNAKALVIDEISMIDGELFDKLEYVARGVMGSKSDASKAELVWGGIQLVVSGDFFQLPPVAKLNDRKFAFEADCWDHTFQFQAALNSVFRQSDLEYVRILEGIRKGELNAEDEKILEQRVLGNEDELDNTVVRLFPRNVDVDRVNQKRLHELGEEIVVYEAFDTGTEPWKSQLNQGIAPTRLQLCKGARVMLTKNTNVKGKLVNGATGTITGFVNLRKGKVKKICRYDGGMILPLVKFDSGHEAVINASKWEVTEGDEVKAGRLQLPLVLAWATSIHKSQGMTLDKLYTDLSRAFGYGMSYVAFSRVRNLDGLYLSGFKPSSVKAHPKVQAFYKKTFE
uniref:ATP-dependent DNA helicase n=1 Tax=Opuntia streptacantha TaxID=393608 RepID=A0A7C9ERL3_OPUST